MSKKKKPIPNAWDDGVDHERIDYEWREFGSGYRLYMNDLDTFAEAHKTKDGYAWLCFSNPLLGSHTHFKSGLESIGDAQREGLAYILLFVGWKPRPQSAEEAIVALLDAQEEKDVSS